MTDTPQTPGRIFATHLGLILGLLLAAPGCGEGYLAEEESGEETAYEPDEDEGRLTFSLGLPVGTRVEVCKTGYSGLNLRTGPGKGYAVIKVMPEDHRATIKAVAGSWYKIDEGARVGFAHSYYLCKAGTTGGGGSGDGGGGGGGCFTGWAYPAAHRYPVTSEFGWRWGRMHEGIDLGFPSGTAVQAAAGGRVEFAGWMSGYGYAVDINHCGKYTTRYAHNKSFVAHHGQNVSKGQTVSRSGSTGNSTGPHLHFEIRIGGRWGKAVNPRNYIKF